jgi:4-hydroxy-2-oxoheptanedioate aldolase
MQKSNVREKLSRGEPVHAVKLAYQDPAIYEMAGLMGFDCAWICNEHIGIDPSKMDSIIRACRASGMDSMIRVKPGDYRDILHVLEMGAKGIMLPRVMSVAEVKKVVADMKFFPQGRRGADGVNAEADFGLVPFADYLRLANEKNFLMIQVEDPEAVEIIEQLAEIDGVDIIFVGPGDLSVNYGIPGQLDDPRILKVCERVAAACKKNGKAAGIPAGTPERVRRFMDMGYSFICKGSDYYFIKNGLTALKTEMESFGFKFRSPLESAAPGKGGY